MATSLPSRQIRTIHTARIGMKKNRPSDWKSAEERRRVAAGEESDLAGLPGVGTPAKADDGAATGGGGRSGRP